MNSANHKSALRRLKIVEGQVRGLQKMIDDDTYCIDIIAQTSAVKEALSGVENLLLEHHLKTHATEQMKRGNEAQAIDEIIKVYRLKRKA